MLTHWSKGERRDYCPSPGVLLARRHVVKSVAYLRVGGDVPYQQPWKRLGLDLGS
jgi:hypothetical protein